MSGTFKAPSGGTYLFIVTVTNEVGVETQMALHRFTDSILCKTYAGGSLLKNIHTVNLSGGSRISQGTPSLELVAKTYYLTRFLPKTA